MKYIVAFFLLASTCCADYESSYAKYLTPLYQDDSCLAVKRTILIESHLELLSEIVDGMSDSQKKQDIKSLIELIKFNFGCGTLDNYE